MKDIQHFPLSTSLVIATNSISGFLLLLLALVPTFDMIIRLIGGSGLIWSNMLMSHLVIWITWLGGFIASRDNAHLSLSASVKTETFLGNITFSFKEILGCSINVAFGFASISFLLLAIDPSMRLVLSILPAGFFLMGVSSISLNKNFCRKLLFGLFLGIVLGWPALVNIFTNLYPEIPPFLFDSTDFWYNVFPWLRWPMIVLLILLGIRGMPIYLLLGGTALFLFAGNWGSLEILPNESYNLIKEYTIAAIPLFTLAGFVLSENSSSTRLVRFFKVALSWFPGGVVVVVVISCAYFTTFTGASGVTILALGTLLAQVLNESGQYKRNFSIGLITSSGSIGLLFPPALPIIMYSVAAQISIKDMFKAGLLPGIILVLAVSAMGIFRSRKSQVQSLTFNLKEFFLALRGAAGELLLPVFLLFCYFLGITNLIETAAVAVLYTLLLCFSRGELSVEILLRILKKSVPVIGGVLIILAMAKTLSYYIVDAQVPTLFTAFFREHVPSRFLFLILLNLALLLTGAMIDIYSAILVVAPLIIPLGELYGVHPIQLGIIFLANLQLGYLTPPVGMNLFLASYAFEKPLGHIYRQVAPFLIVLIIGVLLITYVPWFSLIFI